MEEIESQKESSMLRIGFLKKKKTSFKTSFKINLRKRKCANTEKLWIKRGYT